MGINAAANDWRGGNLLGQIDRDGMPGCMVSTCARAREGARPMRHAPLIGWDIACTAEGAVIVEMNGTPDVLLVQRADRIGVLGPDCDAFLAKQRAHASTHRRRMRNLIDTY
ncbi:hypothetical protein SAMN05216360_10924 [Methylobacterium phyllostachyos]|uniref:Alpha-L-glutamate ligase-related protein ATP-grasp domain-containing protein n=1 Tax=Methylobacterium phyllostachyos TaxID=582672 RepID=A0A1H0C548_9HYPH|nr:hypothetical protein [Methylobacterium phyllostachyos]SDN52969.1 hypothetical protein SAMN05216360_10924 [Methylobacterium phyllostachyos]